MFSPPFSLIHPCVAATNKLPVNRNAAIAPSINPPTRKSKYAQIRIFDLYDPSPWRDSDLGITPNMEYAKEWCTFYEPIYAKE